MDASGTVLMTVEELEGTQALPPARAGSEAQREVMRAVAACWALNPKMRFGQVVQELIKGKMGIGGRASVPLYYVSDEVIVHRAKNLIRKPR